MNARQRRTYRRLYEAAFGNHVDYWITIRSDAMVHNRLPDDEYATDIQEARRLIALNESMHNGKIRDERGEAWYGSQEMLEWDRAVTADMGILLTRIMQYADKVRVERDRYMHMAKMNEYRALVAAAPDRQPGEGE